VTALTRPRTKHNEYQNHEKRIEVMDEQRLAAVLLFPTLGVGVEQDLRHDPGATMACLSSFNKWLEEDWASRTRTVSSPHR
jgi:hypothetical protein